MTHFKIKSLTTLTIYSILSLGKLSVADTKSDAFSGDFSEFGVCTLKFIRTDGNRDYRDYNEALIAINLKKRNGYLLQTVKEGVYINETFLDDDNIAKDFHVYENCAVTIAFNVFYYLQWYVIRYGSLDNYRTNKLQNFVAVNKNFEKDFTFSSCLWNPGKIYSVKVEKFDALDENILMQWNYFCPYCSKTDESDRFKSLKKNQGIAKVSVYDYVNEFDKKLAILVYLLPKGNMQSECSNWLKEGKVIKYDIYCPAQEKYLSLIFASANITRKPVINTEQYGEYGYLLYNSAYKYFNLFDTNSLIFSYSDGLDILFSNFEKKSEKNGISQWIAPLEISVWIYTLVTLLIVAIFYIASKGKNVDVFLFEMARMFLKQPIINLAKLHIFVLQPLVFFSLVLINHYEYFVTSGLIVPIPFKELITLGEFLENNYTIVLILGHILYGTSK